MGAEQGFFGGVGAWIRERIARQLVLGVMLLVAVMALGAGSLSYALTYGQVARLEEERLGGLLDLTRQRIDDRLQALLQHTADLAKNSLIVNALVDSEGRATYLKPFLSHDRSSGSGAPEIGLFSYRGQLYAANAASPTVARLDTPAFRVLLAGPMAGRVAVMLGDETLRVAFPVIYESTGQPEGVLVASVAWRPLMESALPTVDFLLAVALREAGAATPLLALGPEIAAPHPMTIPLNLTFAGQSLAELVLEFQIPADTTIRQLTDLRWGYAAIGSVTLLLLLGLVVLVSQRLTAPLRHLSQEAAQASLDREWRSRLPVSRRDEVGQLARALETMVARLSEAQQVLERRVAERTATLNQTSSRLQAILESVVDGIVTLDSHGLVLSANPAAERIFAVPEERLCGTPFLERLETSHATVFPGPAWGGRRTLEGRRSDGSLFPLELAVSRVPLEEGGFYIALVRDITSQRQTEAEVRKLALVASRTANGVVITDPQGRVDWVNAGFTRITGYTLAAIKGQKPGDVLQGPASDPATIATMHERLLREEGFHVEIINYHQDGHPYWVDVQAQPVRDDNGVLVNFIAIETDISARKEAESALKLAASVTLNTSEGIIITDSRGTILSVNPAFSMITGFDREDVVGGNPRLWKSHRHGPEFYAAIWKSLEQVSHWRGEIWNRRKDGSLFLAWMTISLIPGTDGRSNRYVALFDDITERYKIRQAIEEKEAQYRDLIEGSIEGILIVRPDLSPVFANSSCASLFGFASPDALMAHHSLIDRIHPTEREAMRSLARHLRQGAVLPQLARLHAINLDGDSVWINIMLRAVKWQNETCLQFTMVDITDGVHAEEEREANRLALEQRASELAAVNSALEQARRAADAANEAKSQFLAVMSHELRTPMTGILGMASLLLGSTLSSDQRERVLALQRSAESLLTLLNDILDFSKIEAGRLQLETIDYNPGLLLEDIVSLVGIKAAEKGLTLAIKVENLPPALKGDPTRMRQILLNIVGNAIKFTRKGSVSISVHVDLEQNLPTASSSSRLSLRVEDTGIGMSAEHCARVFQPFTQADVSTTRRFGGTGLGLAISRRLVEAMNGSIHLSSRENEGTVVSIALPVVIGDTAALAAQPVLASDLPMEDQPRPASGLRVLVAEDNEVNRLLLLTGLERLGHQVRGVENGQQALGALQAEHFDLVVMDLQMPVMDGADATRAIRQLPPPLASLPVIALSADLLDEMRTRHREAGFSAFLTKPVHWRQLSEMVLQLTAAADAAKGATADAAKGAAADGGMTTLPAGADATAGVVAAFLPASPLSPSSFPEAPFTEVDFDPEVIAMTFETLPAAAVKAVMATLLERFPLALQAVMAALVRNNGVEVRQALHSLKGMAGQFGANKVRALCLRMEQENTPWEEIVRQAPMLEAAMVAAQEALRRYQAGLSGEPGDALPSLPPSPSSSSGDTEAAPLRASGSADFV